MIRSKKSVRRFSALLVAMLALAIAVPAGAFAQNINPTTNSPTNEEYDQGVLGVAASGGPGEPSGGSTISELPFTGLDVAAIAAIGVGLVGAGFVVRRAARPTDKPTLS
jgi:hypothetical protein